MWERQLQREERAVRGENTRSVPAAPFGSGGLGKAILLKIELKKLMISYYFKYALLDFFLMR